jgi:hypothetical protein
MSETSNPRQPSGIRVTDRADAIARLPTGALPDPWTTPLEQLDVSDSRLYQQDAWRPYFERLRAEDPVHFTPDSPSSPPTCWARSRSRTTASCC